MNPIDSNVMVAVAMILWVIVLGAGLLIPFLIQGKTIEKENLAQREQLRQAEQARQVKLRLLVGSSAKFFEKQANETNQTIVEENGENSRGGFPDFPGGRAS